jgi:putative spermidine/putrescine transport system permease protein
MIRLISWATLILGCLFFILPLVGMTEFSLKMRRGEYSFDAYARVFEDPTFWATFSYSLVLAGATIVMGIFLVVPTAYWVRLKLPQPAMP